MSPWSYSHPYSQGRPLRPTAADIGVPTYAIDEQTAIKVVDGSVEVVSEGQWKKFGS